MNTRFNGLVVLITLLFCFPLSGGGQKEEKRGAPIPLNYFSYYGDPHFKYEEMELLAGFEDEFPVYEVHENAIPYEEYDHSLRTYLASDRVDILMTESGFLLNEICRKGQALDLSSSLESLDPEGSRVGYYRKFPVNRKGLFYLPVSSYSWGIYYKPSLFTRLNLDAPENWEEFLMLCKQLKDADVTPLALGSRFSWTVEAWFDYLNLRLNGPEFHEKLMSGEISFQDERAQNVRREWNGLVMAGYFPENASSLSWLEGMTLFETEKAGMYLMGDFIMNAVHPGKRDDLDFFSFPLIRENIPVAEIAPSEGYIIASEAEHPEAAVKLLAYILEWKYKPLELKARELIQGADILFQVYEKQINPESDGSF